MQRGGCLVRQQNGAQPSLPKAEEVEQFLTSRDSMGVILSRQIKEYRL